MRMRVMVRCTLDYLSNEDDLTDHPHGSVHGINTCSWGYTAPRYHCKEGRVLLKQRIENFFHFCKLDAKVPEMWNNQCIIWINVYK